MTVLFVEKEIIPYIEYQKSVTYRALLKGIKGEEFIIKDLYLGTEKSGMSVTKIKPLPRVGYSIYSSLDFKSKTITIAAKSETQLSEAYSLDLFKSDLQVSYAGVSFKLSITGTKNENKLKIETTLKEIDGLGENEKKKLENLLGPLTSLGNTEITLPDDATLLDFLFPVFNAGKPYIGKEWSMYMVEFGTPVLVKAVVDSKEKIKIEDKEKDTFLILFKKPDADVTQLKIWVDENGDIVKENISFIYDITSIVVQRKKQ